MRFYHLQCEMAIMENEDVTKVSRLDGSTAAMYVGARRMAVIVHEGNPLSERSDHASGIQGPQKAQEVRSVDLLRCEPNAKA